jgi:regulator of sirC expression with transglutaminase-like and TPR domain
MEETTEAACLAGLPESAPRGTDAFDVAGPPAILLRMLNNLKGAFVGSMAWHRALDILDAQLALVPEEPGLHLERGEYWSRLGVISSARDGFAEAARLTADRIEPRLVEIRRLARDRLHGLAGEDDVLH